MTRLAVYDRDQQRCQRCSRNLIGQRGSIHHRVPRGLGGSKDDALARAMGYYVVDLNSLSNLVLICGTGTTGCHGEIESRRTQAYEDGWLVHREIDPATVPILRFGRTLSMLADSWTRVDQPA